MPTFIVDPVEWKKFTASPAGPVFGDINNRGRRLQMLAKRQAGKKTHALANSMTTRTTVDARGVVNTTGSDNRIALLHHEGSRPHPIYPRKAKTLRFVQNGRVRYAQRVYHPGTRANRYLTDNLPRVIL